MKTTRLVLIGVILCAASVSDACLGQTRSTGDVRAAELKVLEMKSVPDGHFLVNLQGDGRDRLVNVEVKDNVAKCVNSNDAQLQGLQGKFQLIGNGVFLIFFQNENHRASQYWLFRQDGTAAVKEVPDRGERQTAVPVKDDSLEALKKNR
jgi:flagellar basal body-associated protein FliL